MTTIDNAQDTRPRFERCPRCYGRGYKPEARRPSKRNPNGHGFYARTCPRCDGTGATEVTTHRAGR